MSGRPETRELEGLRTRNTELELRLQEAEETRAAIRAGEVDALVVGDDIYTLESVGAASNRLRKDVLAQMEDAVVARDAQGHVIYLNPAAERRYAMTASQALGRAWADLCEERWTDPQDAASAQQTLAQTGHCHTSNVHVTRSGEAFPAEASLSCLVDEAGLPIGELAVIRDVSTQRRARDLVDAAHAALHESRAHLEFALAAARIGDWDLDLKTHRARRSLRHDQCFGYREPVARWTLEIFFSHVHPDDREAVEARMHDVMARGSDLHFECRVVWPDASVHWIEVHGATYPGDHGPARMLGIVTDVTERKLAEQSLRDADRNKDEFLATLAHELRNPLAPIRNALALLRMSAEPRVQEDARNVIERQLTQMVHLVDDLMDISRITQGKVTLRREPVDVGAAIQQAVETSRPLIEARRHAMSLDLPAPGELVVLADLTRLIQIVSNLLTNAAKYTPEGGTIVVATAREDDAVAISVQDDGPGIAADVLPHVFDMFAQVGLTLERAQGGLGIGLALVRKFTELHGGTVSAESAGIGHGSRFTLRLPLSDRSLATPGANQADTGHGRNNLHADARVLVVDDNIDSAESLSTLLDMLGCQTRAAHDGQAALVAAGEFHPHAVLLDIGLPLLSGHEVARELRRQPGGANLLLIAMSGWGQDDDRRKSHQAGFDHHLVKPVDLDEVNALIEAHRVGRGG